MISERAPATSLFRRRASAPASDASFSAPRSAANAAKAAAGGSALRSQPASAAPVRGSVPAISGFSIARMSSAPIGTSRVASRKISSGSVSAMAMHAPPRSTRCSERRSSVEPRMAGAHGRHAATRLQQATYCAAQDAKRFSSASPWSAQNLMLNCSASFAFAGAVGSVASTLASSLASALLLVGP